MGSEDMTEGGSGATDARAYGRQVAAWYDQLYGEREEERGLGPFLAHRAAGGIVLEVGVGTGRVAAQLHDAGLSVVGIDVSPEMLERCRTRARQIPVVALEAERMGCLTRLRPSVILCTMATFFQLGPRERQRAVLRAAAECAAPSTVLCIDAWQPPEDASSIPSRRVERTGEGVRSLTTTTVHDPGAGRVDYRQEITDETGVHVIERSDHYLLPRDLEELASTCGWATTGTWASYASQPLRPTSPWFVQTFARSPS